MQSGRHVKARRAHSMPSRFVVPSQYMGEYELGVDGRRRSVPARPPGGGLFPLREEGHYGQPPKGPPPPPPPHQRRERKPKVYSSYAVDNACTIHNKKLAQAEKDYGAVADPRRLRRTSSSSSRTASKSSSPEPVVNGFHGGGGGGGGGGGARKLSGTGRTQSHSASTSWTTTTTTASTNNRRYSSSNNYNYRSHDLRDSSFEENEEYEYEENQRRLLLQQKQQQQQRDNFSRFAPPRAGNKVSLDAMRKAEINSWDSMGILGLSNKMWSDTRKRQESFMETTGHFLREDRVGSHIM